MLPLAYRLRYPVDQIAVIIDPQHILTFTSLFTCWKVFSFISILFANASFKAAIKY